MKHIKQKVLSLLIILTLIFTGCGETTQNTSLLNLNNELKEQQTTQETIQPYTIINDNKPYFEESDYTTVAFEEYSELDTLGRCGVAYANVCKEIMPTTERGSISSVKPSGWQSVQYDSVDGKYLYNRCHLIGYQLAGENANKQNLITGTRYLNIEGMLPFENMVADYIEETNNHVLYRVTPVFEGDNLVASGVLMEARSVEDDGEGIEFCVYCYNIQPGIKIDYATGDSIESDNASSVNIGADIDNIISNNDANSDNNSNINNSTNNSNSDTEDVLVWITENGGKYHSKNDCGNMNPDKAREVTENTAQSLGKEKCTKCWD